MRILTIASLLPVPHLISENDYVIRHIERHLQNYPADEFIVVRPSPCLPFPFKYYISKKSKWNARNIVARKKQYHYKGFNINIIPYVGVGSSTWAHALFSNSIIRFNRKSIKKLISHNPDVIHAHYLFPDGLLAQYIYHLAGIPYVITLQDESRFVHNSYAWSKSRKIINNASVVSTLSPKMKESLEEKGVAEISFLALGVHESFFKTRRPEKNDKIIKFVTVATLKPIKNIETTIRAFGMVSRNMNLSYTIIGDGPEKESLVSLAQKLNLQGVVIFLPSIPNERLASELVKHDVYIQPSFKETFGISYFEALACGLPVILTKNSGAYHLIREYPCYLTADPNDAYDLAEKIRTASDPSWIKTARVHGRDVAKIANWKIFTGFFNEAYQQNKKDAR